MYRADPPQLYTDQVLYYPRLVDLLIAAPHRVNAAGEIELTGAHALTLHASDLAAATARMVGWKDGFTPTSASQ